jgi:hypothetical protein
MDLFPTADSVLTRIADSAVASPRKRKLFLSLLQLLGIISYAESNRRKMISLAERGINPFDIDTVPKGFSGIYPELSASFLLDRSDDDSAQRAAKLTFAALKYREALLNDSLEPEITGGTVIDNYRNHHFFGRVANIRKTGLKWRKEIKDCKNSSHIVVAVDGTFYKLDVIDGSGAVISAEKLLYCIKSMIDAAAQDKSPVPHYGLITANITAHSADIFHADKPDESIAIIDEAIFLLAIDNTNSPVDENEAARDLHFRNYHNRDYRKSLQLVVLRNGFSGATINFVAGIEGVFAARFASWISVYAGTLPQLVAQAAPSSCQKLEFKTVNFARIPVAKLRARMKEYSCDVPLLRRIDAIGREAIKGLNVSPDAFFHAAAHLAYYERFGRIPSVHNFADMRGIKFGSITRYLSTTSELSGFLVNQSKPALLDALEAHKKAAGRVKSGDYPLHYSYFYLYTSVGLKPMLATILVTLFAPDMFRKHVSPDVWASNIPALPGVHSVGRFGTFFKLARKNCLAGHYMLFPDHIKICFLSREKSFLEDWEFDQALAQAMTKMKKLLT